MWYTRKIAQNNATNGVYEYPLNMPISGELQKLLIKLSSDGHLALVVGGAVRDSLMGIKPKDIDIEVYGFLPSEEFLALGEQWDNITNQIKYTDPSSPEYKNLEKEFEKIRKLYAESSPMADLADELRRFPQFGKLAESEGGVVGKSFGVIKFIDKSGQDYDFSLPRKESKTGGGHASFRPVFGDFTPMEAAARRDFTFNSMGYDPLNGQLYDYFGGREDINNGIIRHTSPAFIEDPLRVLRGMQFSSRMGFEVAPETAQLCKEIMQMFTLGKLTLDPQESRSWNGEENKEEPTISRERIGEEVLKMLLKGKYPEQGFKFLVDTGWIKFFPELHDLYGVEQDPQWHPEGDVAAHTIEVMQRMRDVADDIGLTNMSDIKIQDQRAILMLAAMLHDVGKPSVTKQREKNGVMRWTAYGHDRAGVPIAEQFMRRIGIKESVIKAVLALIGEHMVPLSLGDKASQKALNNLAVRLQKGGTDLEALKHVNRADAKEEAYGFFDKADQLGINKAPLVPFIKGQDVIDTVPDKIPGKWVGEIVKQYYGSRSQKALSL